MPPFVRLFNWYISIIPHCLTKGEHFTPVPPITIIIKPIQKTGRYLAIKVAACLVIIYELNLSAKFSNTINILFSGDAIVEMLARDLFHISTHFGYTQIVQ